MTARTLMLAIAGGLLLASLSIALAEAPTQPAATAEAPKAPAYKGPKVELKVLYPPGAYEMTTQMAVKQTVETAGVRHDQTVSQSMVNSVTISQPNEKKVKKMETRFSRIKQSMEGAGMAISYDSDKPADAPGQNPMLAKAVAPLLDARIVAEIGPDDQVKQISGVDEFLDKLAEKESPATTTVVKQMKESMGDEKIKEMFDLGMMLPDKPVGPGDTWKLAKTISLGMLGQMAVSQDCSLRDIEQTEAGKIAIIDFKGDMSTAEGKGVESGPAGATIKNVNFKQAGSMRFNIDTGMMESQKMRQAGTMEMSISSGPPEMKMAMTQDMTIDIVWRKK